MSDDTLVRPLADLHTDLVTLFRERLAVEIVDLDEDLFETGVLDSLVFVELLLGIEQRYGLHVDVDDMDLEAFRTPRTIGAWLLARDVDVGGANADSSGG